MSRVEKLSELTSIRELGVSAAVARDRLAELLGDPDVGVRAAAAAAVESYPDAPDLVRRALQLAREDAAAEVRSAADLALGRVVREGDLAGVDAPGYAPEPDSYEPDTALHAEARGHLLEALRGGRSEGERLAAMEALGCLTEQPEVVAAIERADGGSPQVRAAALRAMGRSGDVARWSAAVVRSLGARETEVALAAAWAAGELGLREAAPQLAALLSERGTSTASAVRAAEALGRVGGDEARRGLEAAASSASDEDVRQAAREALEVLEVLVEIEGELAGGGA